MSLKSIKVISMEIKGRHTTAIVYTDNIETTAISQIEELCNQEFTEGSKIRIMPDAHAGKGCVIGTTMTINDKVVPNLVGVDIGCGVYVVKLGNDPVDPVKLDRAVNNLIPAGHEIRRKKHEYTDMLNLDDLRCKKSVNLDRAALSIGTLGGGNHFIELNKDDDGCFYMVVHSGSRNIGKQVAEYYQNLAYRQVSGKVRKDLAWLEGENLSDYLNDMAIMQKYASLNRKAIAHDILKAMGLWQTDTESFETIHNYIDIDKRILRKGAVSAEKDVILLIPINMRDGSLICRGKGNDEWNRSAPHGAGRLMSRNEAKRSFTLSEYKKSMAGIYTTSVNQSTLDECPMAYKSMQEIIDKIQDTVEVIGVIKPVYNFKAAE
jgi:tRNA-splicing ligase RtcB